MTVLTVNDFMPKKGDDFQIIFSEAPPLDLKLSDIKVSDIRDFPGKLRDPFSLFFDGTQGVSCPQGLYRLRHGSGWEEDIFLVPIAANPDGTFRYQAVFN